LTVETKRAGTWNVGTKKGARKKKSWKELPPAARIGTIVIGAAQLAFLAAAQRDLSRRPGRADPRLQDVLAAGYYGQLHRPGLLFRLRPEAAASCYPEVAFGPAMVLAFRLTL
jgi:hypothetical protein